MKNMYSEFSQLTAYLANHAYLVNSHENEQKLEIQLILDVTQFTGFA